MNTRSLVEGSPVYSANTPAQTAVSGTAAAILSANHKRKGLVVQNTGLTILYLSFGSTMPTVTAYHVALAACTAADDGKGGVYSDNNWVGAVNAIGSAAGGTCVVTEFTLGSPDWNRAMDPGSHGF